MRVSVPISEELKVEVEQHPDDLDLDPELSPSRRFALLLEEGARALRNRRTAQIREAAYVAHAADPAHRESVAELYELAVRDGQ